MKQLLISPLLGNSNSRSFPGPMNVKSEKPTYASVASPAPGTGVDRSAADHGGGGADDSGSDASTVPPSPALSLADLHAALTATAPTFPAYTLRATAAAPSKGRASYVRKFCRVLRTSTMLITGPLRRSWATARFLEAIQADPAWADRFCLVLDGHDGDAVASIESLANLAMSSADPDAGGRFDRYAQALPVASIKDGDCTHAGLVFS